MIDRRTIKRGWARARTAARQALAGHVFAAVGRATYYHTDWMVPYWRDSLVKVAQVETHLFYVMGGGRSASGGSHGVEMSACRSADT